jgi:DNA invertase Pin-like site-specific DNA recombinase
MVDQAIRLGWPRPNVAIIEEDLGQSGKTYFNREGFKWMFDEVMSGRCGIVFCTEVSRLSRESGDWNIFLKVCYATKTLVADGNRVYDLSNFSDRFFLQIFGTFNEAEGELIIMRSRNATLKKAESCDLKIRVPTGYVYSTEGKIIKDPDKNVQKTIALAFEIFDLKGSARATVGHFNREKILFPTRAYGKTGDGTLFWVTLNTRRFYAFLKNPIYTGRYVFGRTKLDMRVIKAELPRVEKYRTGVNMDGWAVMKLNHHEGYISWEKFLENQKRLSNNRSRPKEGRRGAPRSGSALLQGIVFCGICGYQISVHYNSTNVQPIYTCANFLSRYAAGICQSIPAGAVDEKVENLYLAAVGPSHIELALRAEEEVNREEGREEKQSQLRLEQLRQDVERAERRFKQVDPDHRLVAHRLEREWNEKLVEFHNLELEYARAKPPQRKSLDPAKREELLEAVS